MPQLHALAKAVKLAARGRIIQYSAKFKQSLLYVKAAPEFIAGSISLYVKAAASTLIAEVENISLAVEATSRLLWVDATTDFTPYESTQSSLIGMAMVGDFMMG
jgi:hypothetical protein